MCNRCNTGAVANGAANAVAGSGRAAGGLLMLPSGFQVGGGCGSSGGTAQSVFSTVARMVSANAAGQDGAAADQVQQPVVAVSAGRTDSAAAAVCGASLQHADVSAVLGKQIEKGGKKPKDASARAENPAGTSKNKGVTRRKKLWELPVETYCTVLGTCFTVSRLRQLIVRRYRQKHKGGYSSVEDISQYSDYELHVDACHVSRTKNPLAVDLQKDMDVRYAAEVSRCRKHTRSDDLLGIWQQALSRGDVAGYIWALLTHPSNTAVLTDQICRDMHMLQHHMQPQMVYDREKVEEKMAALERENATLSRALADAQRRSTANMDKHQRTTERLRSELVRLRGQAMHKDSLIAFMEEDLRQFQDATGQDGGIVSRLEKSLVRERALEQRLKAMKASMKKAEKRVQKLEFALHNQVLLQQAQERADSSSAERGQKQLAEQTESPVFFTPGSKVLCVGGKSKKVPEYRVILESTGADFLHHDGGLENNQSQLETALAASDVVICQTGCISHNAYWRVKNHCKRTGKQCIYVDNPSTSSLLANLQKAAVNGEQQLVQRSEQGTEQQA